jgi:hypothetical protein
MCCQLHWAAGTWLSMEASAPAHSSSLTTRACPRAAARCSAVLPACSDAAHGVLVRKIVHGAPAGTKWGMGVRWVVEAAYTSQCGRATVGPSLPSLYAFVQADPGTVHSICADSQGVLRACYDIVLPRRIHAPALAAAHACFMCAADAL